MTQEDLSRFGRNSIETGYFIERVFPLYHTRFISVSDDFDTANFKGDTGGIDIAFKYLISECYSRDMSMKTKSAKYAKMRRGEYQSVICPYGYRKSADGRMEPDEDVAPNVQMIFQWASEGNTAAEITRRLYAMNIPTPGEYRKLKGKDYYNVSRTNGVWSTSTVLRILEDQRYIGTYVIGKRKVKEIGSRHTQLKDESEWFKIFHALQSAFFDRCRTIHGPVIQRCLRELRVFIVAIHLVQIGEVVQLKGIKQRKHGSTDLKMMPIALSVRKG